MSGRVPPRTYLPQGRFDPPNLTCYDPTIQLTRLQECTRNTTNLAPTNEIAITIDGACRGNGTNQARGAWGVYFGPRSQHNSRGLLQNGPQTNQRAEIVAAIKALDIMEPIIRHYTANWGMDLDIVLVTDSDYLAMSMTQWVWNWLQNGWTSANGGPVVNGQLLELLHDRIERLENTGTSVKFWRVSRDFTQEADRLANEALDGN